MNDDIEALIRDHQEWVAEVVRSQKDGRGEFVEPFDDGAPELGCDALEVYDPQSKRLTGPDGDEAMLARYWWVAASTCETIRLARTKGFPPKTKCCPLRCRSWYISLYVKICHPAVHEIIADVEDCAREAAIAAGIAALLSGSAAAVAAFKIDFYRCIMSKGHDWAKELSISIYTDTENGPWRRC